MKKNLVTVILSLLKDAQSPVYIIKGEGKTNILNSYYGIVNTSEETTMYIWIVLIVLSSAAIIAINLKKRKK